MLKLIVILCLICLTVNMAAPSCGELLHASCQMDWVFNNTKCSDLATKFANQFKSCCVDKDITANYTRYTLDSLDVAAGVVKGHIEFLDGYVDKQTLTLTQQGADCSVYACSQSESVSVYDYCANFCDIRNLARGLGYFTQTVGKCSYVPSNGKCPAFGSFGAFSGVVGPEDDEYCNNQ